MTSSPISDLQVSRAEIKDLLRIWKEEQVSNISAMLTEQTALMKGLISDVTKLKTQNEEIKKANEEIKSSIAFINDKYEEIKGEVEALKKEKQLQKTYIEQLENKITDLHHRSRTSCIEIRNVPCNEGETSTDLQNLICNVGKIAQLPVKKSDIRDVYRTGGKQSKQRTVIAEMATVQQKNSLISNVRDFNKSQKINANKMNTELLGIPGKCQPVYISEHLPLNSKKLFYAARTFAKEHSYKYCWVTNGNIYLRKNDGDKQILVTSESSLNELRTNPI